MTVTVPMKFALESLPDLIGAEDYADLCHLLGMVDWSRKDLPTGADFARRVRLASFAGRQRDRAMHDEADRKFAAVEEKLKRGSSPAKIREHFEAAIAELATDQPSSGA